MLIPLRRLRYRFGMRYKTSTNHYDRTGVAHRTKRGGEELRRLNAMQVHKAAVYKNGKRKMVII